MSFFPFNNLKRDSDTKRSLPVQTIPLPMSREVQVDIETDVHPTESIEKVKRAVTNIFPDTVFKDQIGNRLKGSSTSLEPLKEKLAGQQIRAAARGILLKGCRQEHLHLHFQMSKQAAYAGKVSFSKGGPLGDILVIVRMKDPEEMVDHLTSRDRRTPT